MPAHHQSGISIAISSQSQPSRIASLTRQHLNCNLFLIDNDDLLTISVIRANAFVKTDPRLCLCLSCEEAESWSEPLARNRCHVLHTSKQGENIVRMRRQRHGLGMSGGPLYLSTVYLLSFEINSNNDALNFQHPPFLS